MSLKFLGQIAGGISFLVGRASAASGDREYTEAATNWISTVATTTGQLDKLFDKTAVTEAPIGTQRHGLLARVTRVADDSPMMLNLAEIKTIKPDGSDRCVVTMRDEETITIKGEFDEVSRRIQNLQATGNY